MENIRMLVTFVQSRGLSDEELQNEIMSNCESITNSYDVRSDLFVFRKKNRSEDVFITFKAALSEDRQQNQLDNTKFINWKPQTNTFFTINALNYLILGECGEADPDYQINWNKYRNKIIMLRNFKTDNEEPRKVISQTGINRFMRVEYNQEDRLLGEALKYERKSHAK